MGCCQTPPLQLLKKRFGAVALDAHFMAKLQLEYLRLKLPSAEEVMLECSERITKERMAEIDERQHAIQGKFEEQLAELRADPAKVQSYELKHNMSIEEIIGLEAIRRKFIELKNITADNIKKIEKEMIAEVRQAFDTIELKLTKKIIKASFEELSASDLELVERDFRERRDQQLKRAEIQVKEQIKKRVNFVNLTNRFVSVIPMEELMALSAIDRNGLQQPVELGQGQSPRENPCCCF